MKSFIIMRYVKAAWQSVLSLFVKPTVAGSRVGGGENKKAAEHRSGRSKSLVSIINDSTDERMAKWLKASEHRSERAKSISYLDLERSFEHMRQSLGSHSSRQC